MTAEDERLIGDLARLRRDGSVVARFDSADAAAQWRAGIRRLCRSADLRIRTGRANGDSRIVWATHVDHIVTDAAQRAAQRAIAAAYSGDADRAPFHELVRDEQRKMLHIIRENKNPESWHPMELIHPFPLKFSLQDLNGLRNRYELDLKC